MKNKLKEILEKLDPKKEILSESVHTELLQMIDEKEKVIKEDAFKRALDVTNKKLEALDEEYTKKTELLVSKIDESHTKAVKKLVEDIDKDHSDKLMKAIDYVKNQNVSEKMVESISAFLDTYIAEVAPKPVLVDQAKLKRLEKAIDTIKECVIVNDDKVQSEFKEAILDAKTQLDAKNKELDAIMLEKVELKTQLDKLEVVTLLESKTKNMSPKMKAYVETYFKNADKSTIEGKLDEAVAAFKLDEAKCREQIISEAKSKKQIINPVINEDNKTQKTITEEIDPELQGYLNVTKKSLTSKWRIN